MAAPATRRASRASTPPPRPRSASAAVTADKNADAGDGPESQFALVVPEVASAAFSGSRGYLGKACNTLACMFLILFPAWALLMAWNVRRIMYPTFPDVDPLTGELVPKHGNVFALGDECWAEISVGSRKWRFNFTYSEEGFVPLSRSFEVSVPPENASMGWSEVVHAHVVHPKGYRVRQTGAASLLKQVMRPVQPPEYWLLRGEACPVREEIAVRNRTSHVVRGVPKIEVQLLFDTQAYPVPYRNRSYFPSLLVNAVNMKDEDLVTLNTSGISVFDTEVTFRFISASRWRFNQRIEYSIKRSHNVALLGDDENKEMAQLRDLFANTSSALLAATMVASILHLFFEFLALRNDVVFYKNCDVEALNRFVSVQSIAVGIVMQGVLLLYLWDEGANMLLILQSVVTIIVDTWKVQLAMRPSLRLVWGFLPVPILAPKVDVRRADDYDSMAMKWLAIALVPFVLGYGLYTLCYDCHRGWYSYCLKFSASCVYSGGFVLMFPQIFMNYKHKSVAYLPWRKFCYRALNTFIDDLFALVIKMPNMHRLSCFRDDVVFFIYLYQRWIYTVDTARPFEENEFEADAENRSPAVTANVAGRSPNSKKCQ